ncbi:hypothetical protein S40288_11751 [Stachybotrys chartarum IBT 40288]|nr:hypothetical protein S40288_11751 [Stachybotrys chartarum IBT 40288]
MDRREQSRTDQSAYSITESIKDLAVTGFQYARNYILSPEHLAPQELLARLLSTKSYISTQSSLANRNNAARDDVEHRRFEEIGQGQCGTVYSLTGTTMVAKIPNSAAKIDQLFADYRMHFEVRQAMKEVSTAIQIRINVPELHMYVSPKSDNFWTDCGPLFPMDAVVEKFALLSERVFPVPLPVREALVDTLCPKVIRKRKQDFLARPENKSCLIRIYLGRRQITKPETNVQNLKLRNFPLHVNEMEDMSLDTSHFACVMAQTLAILHWKAGIDGNDIEFILGSSPMQMRGPSYGEIVGKDMWAVAELYHFDFGHRSTSIWVIDFNQCARFEENDAGLKQIVDAFFWNDPYYPRPNLENDKDMELWAVFRKQYLDVSTMLTESVMPEEFITRIEARNKKGTVSGLFN